MTHEQCDPRTIWPTDNVTHGQYDPRTMWSPANVTLPQRYDLALVYIPSAFRIKQHRQHHHQQLRQQQCRRPAGILEGRWPNWLMGVGSGGTTFGKIVKNVRLIDVHCIASVNFKVSLFPPFLFWKKMQLHKKYWKLKCLNSMCNLLLTLPFDRNYFWQITTYCFYYRPM